MRRWPAHLRNLRVAKLIGKVVPARACNQARSPLPQEDIEVELGLFTQGGDPRRGASCLPEVNGPDGR